MRALGRLARAVRPAQAAGSRTMEPPMPYQAVPFSHVRPPHDVEPHATERLPSGPRRSHARVAVVSLIVISLVLLAAAVALAAPSSSRLSTQGWRTYKGFEAVSAAPLDANHAEHAHLQLRRLVARCLRLDGRGAQSSAIRATCRGVFRVDDDVLAIQRCSDAAGGGDQAAGVCFLAVLPAVDRDFDSTSRASATVAGTLLGGRCRTAFGIEALRSRAAADTGRKVIAS